MLKSTDQQRIMELLLKKTVVTDIYFHDSKLHVVNDYDFELVENCLHSVGFHAVEVTRIDQYV